MSELKTLEHSTLIVPYEMLNKKFRAAQKTVEREFNRVGCVVTELEQLLAKPTVRAGEVNGVVGSLLDKLQSLKRKASETVEEEKAAASLLKRRLNHLKVGIDSDTSPIDMNKWRNDRVDRFVADYLLRTGYFDTAQRLAEHNLSDYMINSEVFLKAREVELALSVGDTSKWSEWAMESKSKLRRMKSGLELKIRRQEFVELVKKGHKLEAVKFARKYFSELESDVWLSLTPTMGLLALPFAALDGDSGKPVTNVQHYNDMFSVDRWKTLVEEFRSENLRLFCLNEPVFSTLLQCGLSAMKTPKCAKICKEAAAAAAVTSQTTSATELALGQVHPLTLEHRRSASLSSSTGSRTSSPRGSRRSSVVKQLVVVNNNNMQHSRCSQCPLCSGPALKLAAHVPQAHAAQSHLICAYSGEPVNDANPPLALPNGMVYGSRALSALAAADPQGQGRVTCPRTLQTFDLASAERVYVM